MKVLFIVNFPVPYRIDFFNELGKQCDLTVFFEAHMDRSKSDNWEKENIIHFTAIFLDGINLINKNEKITVFKYLKTNRFDHIVVGGYSTKIGMMVSRYLKRNHICYFLNADGGLIKKDSFFKYHIKRYFIRMATYYLSSSSLTDEYLKHYGAQEEAIYQYPFTSVSDKDIIPTPLTRNQKFELKQKLGLPHEEIVIAIGQMIYRKGFDILIKVAKDIHGDILIVGGMPLQEYLEVIQRENIKNVHFIPFQEKELLSKYYQASDVFVLPTREDIWGLVVNEALAHGLPVVTTTKCIAGLSLIKDDINGYIYPVKDENLLIENVNRLLANEALCYQMGLNNIDLSKANTIEEMAKAHIKIFQELDGKKL